MRILDLSKHAAIRLQQRGIAPLVVDLLLEFGVTEKSGDGTTKHYLDKPARRRLRSYAGQLASLLEAHLDCYAVTGAEGTIVTAAHRTQQIKHWAVSHYTLRERP
ncbi:MULTISPECIES: hypothetical protein [Burkholderia]|jgi:rare lipoprotein A (peptidoglycan hydrolase)|nr:MULTISPECIES: hypothetical protein [Burkholderia]MCA8016512.1 hypothetical protein [Burkholderia vietnamiensis]MCB4347892.1 hypothetical protein [Burkholderia vietnamiensis]MDN7413580.1 hypothetical protein [Burkholderia vietnamiensis]MDN8071340.1 hypothetical protein [Burkholderia vietnamiensis]RQR95157.1 hypothetical protein DIE02_32905 [Burkholderia sp. Bp8991]